MFWHRVEAETQHTGRPEVCLFLVCDGLIKIESISSCSSAGTAGRDRMIHPGGTALVKLVAGRRKEEAAGNNMRLVFLALPTAAVVPRDSAEGIGHSGVGENRRQGRIVFLCVLSLLIQQIIHQCSALLNTPL